MALELVKSENFGTVQADIYSDGNRVFMTIDQLARCLEYADKSGVEKIIQRNDYLKNPEFLGTDKLSAPNRNGFSEQKTCLFTEDGIYEVTMLSKQPKAREFRAWIREVLKSIRKHGMYAIDELVENPDLAIKALIALKEEREERKKLEQKVEDDKPKVQFADTILKSKDNIKVGDMARILSDNNLQMGRNKMFEYLRNNKIVDRYNIAYQNYINQGYFVIEEGAYSAKNSKIRLSHITLVTPKGQVWIVNKIKKYLSEKKTAQD